MSDIATRRLNNVASHLAPPTSSFERLRVERKPGQVPYLTPLDPIRFLLRSAMVYANKTAVVHGDRSYTYSTLSDRVLKLANVLIHDFAVKPGDRVAILCQNIPANLEASFAVPAIAAVLVPLNTRLVAAELEYVIGHSGASVVIVQEELKNRLPPSVLSSVKVIDVANYQNKGDPPCPYEQLLDSCAPRLSWNDLPLTQDENAIISINYTSGSTGRPKGVQCTFRGCYLTALSNCINAQLTPESVYLWTLPMFHCNGWNYPWSLVAVGSTQIMLNKLDYTYIWKLLKEFGVTHYCAAPTVQNELCNHPDAVRLQRTVRTFSGGAALSSTLIQRLEALNIVPTMVYGLTETYGPAAQTYDPVSLQQFPQAQRHIMAARVGFAGICDDEMRVLNQETGEDVPANGKVIGEICMTGNQTMLGYYKDPKETERVFRKGVFWTGDLAVRHPDGAVEIVDRSKDVIVSGGENISSIEVEGVIARLEQVIECAIVAGPNDKWGERPFAFVVLKPGQSMTPEALIAHCRKYLAGYKCPEKVFFVDSIPKTSTGKIQKFILREGLWKNYTKRVN